MKRELKNFVLALALVALSTTAHAAIGIDLNGTNQGTTEHINLVTGGTTAAQSGANFNIPIASDGLIVAGTANGGSTSMATSTNAIPVSYTFVKLNIGNADPTYQAKTLANGVAGQRVYISVTQMFAGQSATITPATKTGFTSLTVNALDDFAVLYYVDSTIGWVIDSVNSVTINR